MLSDYELYLCALCLISVEEEKRRQAEAVDNMEQD